MKKPKKNEGNNKKMKKRAFFCLGMRPPQNIPLLLQLYHKNSKTLFNSLSPCNLFENEKRPFGASLIFYFIISFVMSFANVALSSISNPSSNKDWL